MPGRVVASVPHWRRSQSKLSSLLNPGRAERQRGAGHRAWLASPTKVGRAAPGEVECTLRAVWRLQWGAGGMRKTRGCEGSHMVRGLIEDPAGDEGDRGGVMWQEV